jgi:hypothetical protein
MITRTELVKKGAVGAQIECNQMEEAGWAVRQIVGPHYDGDHNWIIVFEREAE